MDEAAHVTARDSVLERQLDLLDRHAREDGVDRHPRLGAEARREREDDLACPRRERALARERLPRIEAGAESNQRPCGSLRHPEAAALLLGENGDPQYTEVHRCVPVYLRAL